MLRFAQHDREDVFLPRIGKGRAFLRLSLVLLPPGVTLSEAKGLAPGGNEMLRFARHDMGVSTLPWE